MVTGREGSEDSTTSAVVSVGCGVDESTVLPPHLRRVPCVFQRASMALPDGDAVRQFDTVLLVFSDGSRQFAEVHGDSCVFSQLPQKGLEGTRERDPPMPRVAPSSGGAHTGPDRRRPPPSHAAPQVGARAQGRLPGDGTPGRSVRRRL